MRHILISCLFVSLSSNAARADMGLAPAEAQQLFVSIQGGYLHQDIQGVNGYGVSEVPGAYVDRQIAPDGGWFAGAEFGYENGTPFIAFLPFHRFELYVFGGRAEASVSDAVPPLDDISIKSVDGQVNVIDGDVAQGETTRQMIEFGYRSEVDQRIDETRTITWGYVSFIRNSEEDTNVSCSTTCTVYRTADVSSWMYGSMLMMEPEVRLSSNVALVGRVGAGFYIWEAEGQFRSWAPAAPASPYNAQLSDDEDGLGFRGAFGASLKFILAPGAFLETFAEADYFTDVPVANFSNASPTDETPSSVGTDDMWELRSGARLTVLLSN